MFLKKNSWLIFYALLFIGTTYLILSIYSVWNNILNRTTDELSYLNKFFSSSVTTTFHQQEILLEQLGQQLLNNNSYTNKKESSRVLDRLLDQNKSLVGLALVNVDGQLLSSTANIDLAKMPNLKTGENSKESFIRALESQRMVLGKTYFLSALDSWVIPIHKAIRNQDNQLTGVMIAGIKPLNLFPKFNELSNKQANTRFQAILVHDDSFNYAYISGIPDTNLAKNLINNPISAETIQLHNQAMQKQYGVSMSDMKTSINSVEYFASDQKGENKLYSTVYLPDQKLWSMTFLPRSLLINQLLVSASLFLLSYILVFIIIFFLFLYIHQFEQVNHQLLIKQANQDFLTGLKNRLFLQHTEPEWIHENAQPFSMFFIDLDNFKNINESYGHGYGDLILKQVANRLLSLFTDQSLICRQGGDEFIVLCKKTGHASLNEIANRVLQAISEPYKVEQYQFTIGASIGICRYPDDGDSFDNLFSAADTAMYRAKTKKRNYFIFTNELQQQISRTSKIEQALHSALKNNEIHMVYQPQITSKGTLYGVEALIRWNNNELGSIPPDKFISIAEDNGLILELGHFIIDQTIKDISQLGNSHNYYDLHLSINISVRQFLEQGFLERLQASLFTHKFPSKQLTLEITESIFIEDFEYMMPLFKEIRALGIKISLDDFGTGFSSLSMLRNLPIDELKIDKSFIDHFTKNKKDKMMVLNIINIAKNLGLKTVAEGIEQKDQASFLTEFDCDIQQGYFYSKPVKYNELLDYCSSYFTGSSNQRT